MLLGVLSAILMAGAGLFCARWLGIPAGWLRIGLAPPVGVAALAVLSTWAMPIGVPEQLIGAAMLCVCLTGVVLDARDWLLLRKRVGWSIDRVAAAMLLSALVIPVVVMAQAASFQMGIPNYIHDGAHHAEFVDVLRHGGRVGAALAWYPVGFHAPAAALLSLLPGIDSATGAVEWAVGLTVLAPCAVFGLGIVVWRDARIGAAGALLLALTSNYPYDLHLYSIWPMIAGMLIVVGLWAATVQFLAQPGLRLALLGGLLAAGLLLTHGTEIYTAAIGIAALAAAHWRRVVSPRVLAHALLAVVVALVLCAPYLPTLFGWAAAGGAVDVGTEGFDSRHAIVPSDVFQEALLWASGVSSGLALDLPFRLALLGAGVWIAFRTSTGRVIVWLGLVFVCLVAMFRYIDTPLVRTLFALTLPWGVDSRLLTSVAVCAASLSGAGLVWIAQTLASRSRPGLPAGEASCLKWRCIGRRALTFGVAGGLVSVFLVGLRFSLVSGWIITYSADDGRALAWLGQHATPGEVMLNDGVSDAGIWAPFKANVSIVLPRIGSVLPGGPGQLVRASVGYLDTRADARAAACSLGIQYVYRGARISPGETREFPGLAELRASPALEEVFTSGEASVFRTRLSCPP